MSGEIDFRAVQEHFGFQSPAPVEKDWHVVRAMRAITAVDASPFRLIFAGGTCLARGYRLIKRMSEDADFKVVQINPTPLSKSSLRKRLGELRDRIAASLQSAGFPIDQAKIRSRDDNRYTIFELPYGDSGQAEGLLRSTIQIELNFTKLRRPTVRLPVASFAAEAYGREPEIPSIECVDITETAAEKLVSLTRRTAMEMVGASRAPDPTLVRHIYDLHQIHNRIDRNDAVKLAREIAEADAAEFRNQHPAYAADIAGETNKALAFLRSAPEISERYARFLLMMVYGEPVNFEVAISAVTQLYSEAWE